MVLMVAKITLPTPKLPKTKGNKPHLDTDREKSAKFNRINVELGTSLYTKS